MTHGHTLRSPNGKSPGRAFSALPLLDAAQSCPTPNRRAPLTVPEHTGLREQLGAQGGPPSSEQPSPASGCPHPVPALHSSQPAEASLRPTLTLQHTSMLRRLRGTLSRLSAHTPTVLASQARTRLTPRCLWRPFSCAMQEGPLPHGVDQKLRPKMAKWCISCRPCPVLPLSNCDPSCPH